MRLEEATVVPRDVKRAIAFMEAMLSAAIQLSDVVAASGVAGRTLFKHFRDFKGTTPRRYLRDARLDRVRQALLQAADGETVTSLARRGGFNHMGRLSIDYRRRFGESPSETLWRGRSSARGPGGRRARLANWRVTVAASATPSPACRRGRRAC
jgi:transcriptional regulator GlxA family with amidase domain